MVGSSWNFGKMTLIDGFGNVCWYNMVDYYMKALIEDLKDSYWGYNNSLIKINLSQWILS